MDQLEDGDIELRGLRGRANRLPELAPIAFRLNENLKECLKRLVYEPETARILLCPQDCIGSLSLPLVF